MEIKNLKFLIVVLISCTCVSCVSVNKMVKYKVYWNDLRSQKTNEVINIEFENEENSNIVKRKFKTNVTKKIYLPELDNFEISYQDYTCHSNPYTPNYFYDSDNKKLEIILVDKQYVEVNNYEVEVNKINEAVAYIVFFPDPEEKKWCYLISKNNKFSIDQSQILKTSNLDFESILNNLTDNTFGLYSMPTENFYNPTTVYYVVRSKIKNEYIEVSSSYSDFVMQSYDAEFFEE